MSKIKTLVMDYKELRNEINALLDDKIDFIINGYSNFTDNCLENSNFDTIEELGEEFDSKEELVLYIYEEKEKELHEELTRLEKEILKLS
ncbi:MAG: hypothetical protein ACRCX2_09970 [Paraclostridium sp.]